MDGWKVQDKDWLDYGTIESSRSSCQSDYLDIKHRVKYNLKWKDRLINWEKSANDHTSTSITHIDCKRLNPFNFA